MYIHSSLLAHIERPHCFPSYVVLHLNGQVIISIYPVPCGWTQVISSFMLFFFFISFHRHPCIALFSHEDAQSVSLPLSAALLLATLPLSTNLCFGKTRVPALVT